MEIKWRLVSFPCENYTANLGAHFIYCSDSIFGLDVNIIINMFFLLYFLQKRAIEYFYMEVNMEMTEVNVYTFIYKVVCCKRHM